MNLLTNKIKPIAAIVFFMTFGAITNVIAAPTLDMEQGVLIGINNINLGDNYGEYDVSFNDYSPDTPFYTHEWAMVANTALLEMFTSTDYFQGHDVDMFGPASTRGCNDTLQCSMLTVFNLNNGVLTYDGVTNRFGSQDELGDRIITQSTLGFPPLEYVTFSTWSPSLSPGEVPIPAAAFMFAPALLGFMGFRRKAKNLAA